MSTTLEIPKPDIFIPRMPTKRDIRAHSRKTGCKVVSMGMGVLLNPDGSVEWQDTDWALNALHDAGEQDMLQVFLAEQAHKTKYLGLLNDGTVAETDGTMTAVTEMATPGNNGYNRQQILNTDWTNDGLVGGDYRFSGVEKQFGPISGAGQTATHASLSSTSTTAGILFLTLALSATTSIAINQSFKYILRWTQQ